MVEAVSRALRHPRLVGLKHAALLARGMFFVGCRYRCPCCSWGLRGFVGPWGAIKPNSDGYCPRCNAKARHRRLWLYLEEHTTLFREELRVLEVAPWWALSRRFQQMPTLRFVGIDIERRGPQVTLLGDATSIPLASGSLDAALCIHTLEHIEDDGRAISELHRVLKPGGWALVSVPLLFDRPTLEDPSVTDPADRARLFGERGHVRHYGMDLTTRLEAAGFLVEVDLGGDVSPNARRRFGLRDDENIFHCRKLPVPSS